MTETAADHFTPRQLGLEARAHRADVGAHALHVNSKLFARHFVSFRKTGNDLVDLGIVHQHIERLGGLQLELLVDEVVAGFVLRSRNRSRAHFTLELLDHVLLKLLHELLLQFACLLLCLHVVLLQELLEALLRRRILDDLLPACLGLCLEVGAATTALQRHERGALLDLVGGDGFVVDEERDRLAARGLAPRRLARRGRGGLSSRARLALRGRVLGDCGRPLANTNAATAAAVRTPMPRAREARTQREVGSVIIDCLDIIARSPSNAWGERSLSKEASIEANHGMEWPSCL